MKVDAGRGKLYDAHKTLRLKWEEAQTVWHDGVSKEFEEKVWEPLDMQSCDVLRAIDRLSQLFIQMRNECEGTDWR